MDTAKIFVFALFFLISHYVLGQEVKNISITFVEDAGAVCLDGSPGAYFYDKGFGEGANNLIVYLEGGGWCQSEGECTERSKKNRINTPVEGIGSNKNRTLVSFGTILSPCQFINPDFYNWNRVFISYCDGASFMADIEATKSNLYLRGARIFKAAIKEVLDKGMTNVNNAILMGESAGGLATLLKCDHFRALLPDACHVKCVADSGFFINKEKAARRFTRTNAFHELASVLPSSCTSRINSSLCLFPENFIGDIQTPVFLLNSAFDLTQIQDLDIPPGEEASRWALCTFSLPNCTANELQIIKEFGATFVKKLNDVCDNPSRGMYISNCFIHDFFNKGSMYWSSSNLAIENKTIANAIGDWFFNRNHVRLINETDAPIICVQQALGHTPLIL